MKIKQKQGQHRPTTARNATTSKGKGSNDNLKRGNVNQQQPRGRRSDARSQSTQPAREKSNHSKAIACIDKNEQSALHIPSREELQSRYDSCVSRYDRLIKELEEMAHSELTKGMLGLLTVELFRMHQNNSVEEEERLRFEQRQHFLEKLSTKQKAIEKKKQDLQAMVKLGVLTASLIEKNEGLLSDFHKTVKQYADEQLESSLKILSKDPLAKAQILSAIELDENEFSAGFSTAYAQKHGELQAADPQNDWEINSQVTKLTDVDNTDFQALLNEAREHQQERTGVVFELKESDWKQLSGMIDQLLFSQLRESKIHPPLSYENPQIKNLVREATESFLDTMKMKLIADKLEL